MPSVAITVLEAFACEGWPFEWQQEGRNFHLQWLMIFLEMVSDCCQMSLGNAAISIFIDTRSNLGEDAGQAGEQSLSRKGDNDSRSRRRIRRWGGCRAEQNQGVSNERKENGRTQTRLGGGSSGELAPK